MYLHQNINPQLKKNGNSRPFFQPKLTVNQPDDVYEQEADAMADRVVRSNIASNPQPFFKPADAAIQRKCQHCEEEEKLVHRKESSDQKTEGSSQLDNYVGSLGSSGQKLPDSSRQFFESRFGYDFSDVKIHTDPLAAKSAQSINALAYTTGNDIVFNSGQYAPDSEDGKRLMAHELTHVVQQQGSVHPMPVQRAPAPAGTSESGACLIHFVQGRAEFTRPKEFEKCMNGVNGYLKAGKDNKVVLKGFASQEGTADFNMKLSKDRADKVLSLFGVGHVDTSRITIEAHGADSTYDTDEANRRVEILDLNNNEVKEDTRKPVPKPDKPVDPTPVVDTGKDTTDTGEEPGWFDYCPLPEKDVDDTVVQKYIDDQIALHTDKDTGKIDLDLAFSELNGLRGKKEYCCEVNLASAEHYMYARKEMSEGRLLVYSEGLNIGNYWWKSKMLPFPNAGTGVCPKTHESDAQYKWGLKGTIDGERDWLKRRSKEWGQSPTDRYPDGTWYDASGKMHLGMGPKM